jgi:hypothetical protein
MYWCRLQIKWDYKKKNENHITDHADNGSVQLNTLFMWLTLIQKANYKVKEK